jgi:YesN/AraC family two-component response regulator
MNEYTVLFVDDEPFILNALTRLFRGEPFRIVTATNGAEALERVRRGNIQVVVTDNIMPGMTGVELARRVREHSPETVRIILSGHSDMDALLKAINEGEAFKFVLKPWHDMDLKATVHLALAQYRLTEQNQELISEVQSQRLILGRLQRRYPDIYAELKTEAPDQATGSNEELSSARG